MKAVVVTPDAPARLALADVDEPAPAPNEALVRVECVSVNRGEVWFAQENPPGSRIGWDLAGVVERAAADGAGPAAGQRVVGWTKAQHSWAERAAVPTTELAVLPADVGAEEASTLPVAGLTALYALERGERLLGNRVLVTGATGGVGQYAIQLARLMGARVAAQVRREEQVQDVEALGAEEVIVDPDGSATGSRGPFRLILDGVGGALIGRILPALGPEGRCILYAVTAGMETTLPIMAMLGTGGGRVEGFTLYRESQIEASSFGLDRLLQLLREGKLKTGISVHDRWDHVGAVAQALLDRRYAGKAVLRVADS